MTGVATVYALEKKRKQGSFCAKNESLLYDVIYDTKAHPTDANAKVCKTVKVILSE